MVATAKPRRRKSATTSKYFSMNSPRPWKTQTVPRRGGRVGSQRAKRSRTPRGDLKTPVVAPLGTGFFASATSSMRASLPHVAAEAKWFNPKRSCRNSAASGVFYSSQRQNSRQG